MACANNYMNGLFASRMDMKIRTIRGTSTVLSRTNIKASEIAGLMSFALTFFLVSVEENKLHNLYTVLFFKRLNVKFPIFILFLYVLLSNIFSRSTIYEIFKNT